MKASFRVLELFGVPTHGGSIAASCAWRVEKEIAGRAGGSPVLVASHLRGNDGRVLAHDGPRSTPIEPDATWRRVIVPLEIPAEPGTFLLDFDAVVEGRFWASTSGLEFPTLRIERLPDGGIAGQDLATGQRFRVGPPSAANGKLSRIQHASYGVGESERCVEVPWVLSRYRGERRVLDIGTSFAEPRYVQALRALPIPFLSALDLVPAKAFGGPAVVGDARRPPLRAGTVDLIFAISVIEHVGQDNGVYLGGQHGPSDADGDLTAIRALAELLAPGGRLLVTVPFGRLENHGWFIQYDLSRLRRLVSESRLDLDEMAFFRYAGSWEGPLPAKRLRDCRYGVGASAATGLACLSLARRGGLIARMRTRLRSWGLH